MQATITCLQQFEHSAFYLIRALELVIFRRFGNLSASRSQLHHGLTTAPPHYDSNALLMLCFALLHASALHYSAQSCLSTYLLLPRDPQHNPSRHISTLQPLEHLHQLLKRPLIHLHSDLPIPHILHRLQRLRQTPHQIPHHPQPANHDTRYRHVQLDLSRRDADAAERASDPQQIRGYWVRERSRVARRDEDRVAATVFAVGVVGARSDGAHGADEVGRLRKVHEGGAKGLDEGPLRGAGVDADYLGAEGVAVLHCVEEKVGS
jgi:hypothetical protein